MRFALWTEQEKPDYPNIIFAVHNGEYSILIEKKEDHQIVLQANYANHV